MPNDTPDWSRVATAQAIIDTATATGGVAVTHNGLVVPAGTHTLLAIGVNTVGGNGDGSIAITGVTTALQYVGPSGSFPVPFPPSGLVYFPALVADGTINVTYQPSAGTDDFWLIAVFDPEAVVVTGQSSTFLSSATTGGPLYTHSEVAPAPLLGVTLSGANPAPWQASTLFVRFAATINAGATGTLLAGVAGKVVRVFDPVLSSDAGAGNASDVISLQDSTGLNIQDYRNVATLQHGSAGPLAQASGAGLQLHNFSAANLGIRFTCGYTQV